MFTIYRSTSKLIYIKHCAYDQSMPRKVLVRFWFEKSHFSSCESIFPFSIQGERIEGKKMKRREKRKKEKKKSTVLHSNLGFPD